MRTAGQNDNGKIQKSLWLTETYPEEIEADLQRYYGLNLGLFFVPRSGLSWRKLLVLIEHLPPEAALSTAIRNDTPPSVLAANAGEPEQGRWNTAELLMAALIDEMRQLAWMYASAHSEKTVPRPEPVRRPGAHYRKRRMMSIEDARRIDPRLRGIPDDQVQEQLDRMTGRA